MTEKKVTKKEMYEAVIKMANGETIEMDMAEIVEFAEKEIAALARKAEKAKERAAIKKTEDSLKEAVLNVLTEEPKTISEIAKLVSEATGFDVSASKAQYRLNALANEGVAVKGEVSIPAPEGGKKSVKKTYCLA